MSGLQEGKMEPFEQIKAVLRRELKKAERQYEIADEHDWNAASLMQQIEFVIDLLDAESEI